ncbi:MAG: SEC-C metal-binding domain-containing protein [Candidatus Alcyoniella australis]|nr:SEC-C metal-binding domain-containing protein [Candidatus Alcyoniella australis]
MVRRTRIKPSLSMRKSVVTGPRKTIDIGRNDPCPCGSDRKYKDCCVSKGDTFLRKLAEKQAKVQAKEDKRQAKLLKKQAKERDKRGK